MSSDTATPMMAQYLEIKGQHPDALLFYRMGDFYEMFFADAEAAAAALDIALTKRGQHLGQDIPMCGVPVHAAENYLLALIRKGFRVAIAEQMEDPAEARKRGAKAVVRREVVRLVTPGTLSEEALLEARRHNYLAALAEVRGAAALAWCDMSTGAFRVMALSPREVGPQLSRLAPSELLLAQGTAERWRGEAEALGVAVTERARADFDSTAADAALSRHFGVGVLEGFGQFGRPELAAMGALLGYLVLTQKGRLPLLHPPRAERVGTLMQIDAATRRNLELTESLGGGRRGSLLATIDRTCTAPGARLLERRLTGPSTDHAEIAARHDAVAALVERPDLRRRLRELLRRLPDMDRAVSRLALERGGPRDLGAIRTGLAVAADLAAELMQDLPARLRDAGMARSGFDGLAGALDAALVAEPPLLARDGGYVAAGYDGDLDEARRLRDDGRSVIAALQADYIADTGITSLKIRHNNVLGYFVEVTATHAARMMSPPLSGRFLHRQTTANAARFTTPELVETERRILSAGERALAVEMRVFEELRGAVVEAGARLAILSRALAELDLSAGMADLASELDWTRPTIDDSRDFEIVAGRHPVVEAAQRGRGEAFIANDCRLGGDSGRIWLLTGPNMAGKSTFLRQNALIAILAQAGAFVPAAEARMGLVSQVFSRVGASDDLARGQSTFMVEMVETAAILNQADERALVILDEIGRGTATWDGLSIAWAVLEYLHDASRCRALFATHYHELTHLSGRLDGLENATVAVREWEGRIVFLHEVRKGAADRSYGVQVAQLAGLPAAVVARARDVLETLERGDREGASVAALIDDLPLFSARPPAAPTVPVPSRTPALEARLREVLPDELTPRAALELVYELRAMLDTEGGR